MSGFDYYLSVIRDNYANFDGRARRSEYWYFILFNILAYITIIMFAGMLGSSGFLVIFGIYFFATIIPSLAVLVRRLHDVNESGWFMLIRFIPLIGGIWLLVVICRDSDVGKNRYGSNPKGIGNEEDATDVINSIGENLQN